MTSVYFPQVEFEEAEKLHPARYWTWADASLKPGVWSGVELHASIWAAAEKVVAELFSADPDGGESSPRYWALHWRRGDGLLGPTKRRAQQYEQASPENLVHLFAKATVRRAVGRAILVGSNGSSIPDIGLMLPENLFVMTDETNSTNLEIVRATFADTLGIKVAFLSDVWNSVWRAGTQESPWVLPLLVDVAVACRAMQFIIYSDGLSGGGSMPGLLVNELRKYRCGTASGFSLFGGVIASSS